jgi:hypothetical protein
MATPRSVRGALPNDAVLLKICLVALSYHTFGNKKSAFSPYFPFSPENSVTIVLAI